jgi:3-carboxy-cis,cis-muconate cycloisomerase
MFTAPFVDADVLRGFSDEAWARALVRVESALAVAQGQAGVIPSNAAAAIAQRTSGFEPDVTRLASGIERDGFPLIELVAQLRQHVGAAARYVHWGATTQDILDTALVLQLREALDRIEAHLAMVTAALAALADRHRTTLMIGRTHAQPALPTTFGLKAASWLAPLVRHRRTLSELRPRWLNVQLGGAAGTLAAFGANGPAVAEAFARELGLNVLPMPWHTQREPLLELSGQLSLVGVSLSKFAQDVLLLAQGEVGEVRESADVTRGGSSAMPQKQNPILSETVLVAARAATSAHAALLTVPPPEHERGTQTMQSELLHLPQVCALTGGALRAAARLATSLVVNETRMLSNLHATHGVLLAEAVALVLAQHVPPAEARKLLQEACATASREKRHLLEIVRVLPSARPALAALPRDEAGYLGSAGHFIDAVLAEAALLPGKNPAA